MRRVKQSTYLMLLLVITSMQLFSQTTTQTIKGTILDRQSEIPLIGATIEWVNETQTLGTVTDIDGRYTLPGVSVGRQAFVVSYLGYESMTVPNVLVTAGKEVILDVSLEESIEKLSEVVVTAEVVKDQAQNEMATISARTFSLEEVNRFSGGRNDVARLAGNFAGVSTADDSRNDIVIRGNSPTGLLWRLEGIPIPNPNLFSTLGTTGGPVSALNPNLLRNSDFLTSAFPSEYGNALSGVFDLGFRTGNRDRWEFTGQMGAFSGLEAMVEGPINRENGSSMVVSYRHSFVELADIVGIPVGTNAVPNYRDIAFKVDLGKSKLGKFSFFGIGGLSSIDFLASEVDENDLFAEANVDSYARSRFGVLGMRHNLILNDRSYWRTTIGASTAVSLFDQDNYLAGETESFSATDVDDISNRYTISSYINTKFNAKWTLRTGVLGEVFDLSTAVADRNNQPDLDGDGLPDWFQSRDFDGSLTLLQAFSQAKWRMNTKWELNIGLHGQWLTLNNDAVLEPRATISYQPAAKHRLTLGYGLHHQMQPLPVIFSQEEISPGVFNQTNQDLSFTRANHMVLGYDWKFAPSWRLKSEVYYQYLDRVPVEQTASSFSMLNAGADFVFPSLTELENTGTGYNTGVELTIEKFFSQGFYTLFTASLFDSQYEGSDGVQRNTAFNNQYVVNFLAGKEIKFGKNKANALTFDTKVTYAGGRFYTPVDLATSQLVGFEVLQDDLAFTERIDPYFRWDVKFGYQLNSSKRKLSQTFFIDLQNVTGRENVFQRRYNPNTNEVNNVLQAGFFPDILYRIQF
ncbi:MAG: TonB-dependent receptor [Bacteroidota bacterium]